MQMATSLIRFVSLLSAATSISGRDAAPPREQPGASPAHRGHIGAAGAEWKSLRAGLDNFHQVDTRLYRGAQPTATGMLNLRKMGIRTVVNLRTSDTDAEMVRASDLEYYRVPMLPWLPRESHVVAWLRIVVEQQKRGAVFIHCRQGADRTGMMVAVYRVVVNGWSKEDALREMTQGGFHHHRIWKDLRTYVERMDVASIRRQAGLDETAPVSTALVIAEADHEGP